MHYTGLTRSRNNINSSLLDYVHGYCRDLFSFQQILYHKLFKTLEGEGYPIYGIVRMCVPNSPLFKRPQAYDKPPFFKKKHMNGVIFFNWNDPNFLTPMYMHICFDQIPVKPLFSHLHKAGFLMMRIICKLEDMKGYIHSESSI